MIRVTLLLSAGLSALSLGACNKNAASENGAYVAGSTDSSLSVSSQALPPSNEYQAVANSPPPPLPVYDQPPIPGPGYVWTPGYWDWSNDVNDYYWVPGAWTRPPETGLLWTPGYWRFYNGHYLFSDGYWASRVGFYGGVDYGYGYGGSGYAGGRWQGNRFYYNSQTNNLGRLDASATYSQNVSSSTSRVSFNGGPSGLRTDPAQAEIAAAQARHSPPTQSQREQARMASAQPQLRASVNQGKPPIAATSRPTAFRNEAGANAGRSAATDAPPMRPGLAGPAAQGPAGFYAGRHDETSSRAPAPMTVAKRPNEIASAATVKVPSATAGGPRAPEVHAPQMRVPVPREAAPQLHARAPMHTAPQTHAAQLQVRAGEPQPGARPTAPQPHGAPEHHP